MSQLYKHVLIIGGTAGIGRAMGDRFLDEGMKVTIVGRRHERLDEFVAKYGREKAAGMHFDIEDLASIPKFAERCVVTIP
jgi:NADP-dependent 3-hydroxy acid dehydrogenase YdfG